MRVDDHRDQGAVSGSSGHLIRHSCITERRECCDQVIDGVVAEALLHEERCCSFVRPSQITRRLTGPTALISLGAVLRYVSGTKQKFVEFKPSDVAITYFQEWKLRRGRHVEVFGTGGIP